MSELTERLAALDPNNEPLLVHGARNDRTGEVIHQPARGARGGTSTVGFLREYDQAIQAAYELGRREALGQARELVREGAQERGVSCPVCEQFVKVYRRGIGSMTARQLIKCWRHVNREGDRFDWFHMPSVVAYGGGDVAKLRFYDILEEATHVAREDGGRAGMWRFTALGAAWVTGAAAVPRYAYIFDNRLLHLDGEPWTIEDALGKKFNLRELMEPAHVDA